MSDKQCRPWSDTAHVDYGMDLGLRCLRAPVCPNIKDKYGMLTMSWLCVCAIYVHLSVRLSRIKTVSKRIMRRLQDQLPSCNIALIWSISAFYISATAADWYFLVCQAVILMKYDIPERRKKRDLNP